MEVQSVCALDVFDLDLFSSTRLLVLLDEGQRRSSFISPTCAPDPMDIIFISLWDIVVYHVTHIIYIEPA